MKTEREKIDASRYMNPATRARVARTNNLHVVMLSFPLTARIKRHIVYNPNGESIGQFIDMNQVVAFLLENNIKRVMLDSIDFLRPVYAQLKRTLEEDGQWRR